MKKRTNRGPKPIRHYFKNEEEETKQRYHKL